jgi:hypothetical protein
MILQSVVTLLPMYYFVLYACLRSMPSMLSPMIALPHNGSLPLDLKEIVVGRYCVSTLPSPIC